jgi:hypothetical protein
MVEVSVSDEESVYISDFEAELFGIDLFGHPLTLD